MNTRNPRDPRTAPVPSAIVILEQAVKALEHRAKDLEMRVKELETAAAQPEEAKKRGWWSWLRSEDER